MPRLERFAFVRDPATRWDILALVLVIGLIAVPWEGSRSLLEPLSQLKATPQSLDPSHLPEYATRTTLRMLAALGVSLLFTFTYATWAAKSERAGKLLVPLPVMLSIASGFRRRGRRHLPRRLAHRLVRRLLEGCHHRSAVVACGGN